MDFEIKKSGVYKTRDGEKVEIVGRCENGIWLGYRSNGAGASCYRKDGLYAPQYGEQRCNHDIVAEWAEPKRIKGWIGVWSHPELIAGCSHVYTSKEQVLSKGFLGLLACIEIDVLEGQGLDGSAR